MPVYVKRTKSVKDIKDQVVSTRVHFAVKVAPAGNVTLWTDRPEKAAPFADTIAEKILAFYAKKAADKEPVGVIDVVNDPVAAPAKK